MSETAPLILLDAYGGGDYGRSWRFSGYVETLQALEPLEVLPLLARIEKAAADGLHAVGFIAYEAAAGLNPDLWSVPPLENFPLAWFALFSERVEAQPHHYPNDPSAGDGVGFEPDISRENYLRNVERIREYIACGDCYQVNYTFNLSGACSAGPLELYRKLSSGQHASYSAYIDTGRFTVASASPELFFSLKDGLLRTRPMKGTARRGRWLAEDLEQIAALKASAKERAENLMIVDLLRNDLGIIAATGSVKVESLFDVETYPTLHQLTSTVTASVREGVGLAAIFSALFPCGSITGAPKRRSMEIITELEARPRGVYCGAIGYVAPGGEALFSVAIRTVLFDRDRQTLSLGIGSGITTDSKAAEEYQECLTKSAFLFQDAADFSLIESLRLENGSYYLLQRHLERLRNSAIYFGFTFDVAAIKNALEGHAADMHGTQKVRLLLDKNGEFAISAEPLTLTADLLRLAVSDQVVNSLDTFRYHKTTRRESLDAARRERPDLDEVLFVNERGELTEGSYHNLLLKIDGRMLTPKLDSGLLAGVMRQELLEKGATEEAVLVPADLVKADEIWLINSVRGLRRAVLSTINLNRTRIKSETADKCSF